MTEKPRRFCLTIWNDPKGKIPDGVRYAIYGREICPDTGRLHWQSYIELYKPQRFSWIKRRYGDDTMHIEESWGTRDEARDYCMKDKEFIEVGNWISGQGYRSDLQEVCDLLKNGTKLTEIIENVPRVYCQYRNGLKDIAAHYTQKQIPKWRPVEVILLTGPTRCGKTRMAMEEADYKIQGSEMQWWDGYDGEETILIDEYNNNVEIDKMLAFLEGYKKRLGVKGGHCWAQWNKIYITTNLRIDQLHANAKSAHREALFARFSKIVDFWDMGPSGPRVILETLDHFRNVVSGIEE